MTTIEAHLLMISRTGPVCLLAHSETGSDLSPSRILGIALSRVPLDRRGPVIAAEVQVGGKPCRLEPATWTHLLLEQICPGASLETGR